MKICTGNSFSSEAFKENPAAVCLADICVSEEKMLQIVKEPGLSETALI